MDEYHSVDLPMVDRMVAHAKAILLIGGSLLIAMVIDWPYLLHSLQGTDSNHTEFTGEFGPSLCDKDICFRSLETAISAMNISEDKYASNGMNFTACLLHMHSFFPGEILSESFAHEACFEVQTLLYNRCTASSPRDWPPFDIPLLAIDVCRTDLSGYPRNYIDTCACELEDPIADPMCCRQYAMHVTQRSRRIANLFSCVQLQNHPPEILWCPHETDTFGFLANNSFTRFACEYYKKVLSPACDLEILDPDTNLLADYLNSTCPVLPVNNGPKKIQICHVSPNKNNADNPVIQCAETECITQDGEMCGMCKYIRDVLVHNYTKINWTSMTDKHEQHNHPDQAYTTHDDDAFTKNVNFYKSVWNLIHDSTRRIPTLGEMYMDFRTKLYIVSLKLLRRSE